MGDYTRAASVMNAVLAVAPGMNWTTISGLFSDVAIYTEHLRRLEDFSEQNPNDAAAHFVLAYHYMVMGYLEQASQRLELVIENQPEDQVAKRILDGLRTAEQGAMAGLVKSRGPDKFQFIMVGSPPNDEGLTFGRIDETSDANREQ
ncbi:MAG: tetratricopeptide repeat protein [Planctomycetaceae bacterium]|nr:MAG: tetratricopeptide repeat protein [Planctomycetaceae bacterium]